MSGKASFDDVDDLPDPRGYMRTLSGLEYQIPEHGRGVFRELVRQLRARRGEAFSVVDLCSSYGVNPALLNHELTLDDLYERYASPEVDGLTVDELAEADREFYRRWRRPDPVRCVGLDVAAGAVTYAERVGLIESGSSENLEEQEPSGSLARQLSDVGLVTVTGGVGYITESTFDRILAAGLAEHSPWVAAFVLRWVDMSAVAKVLESYGLVTERLEGRTFRQRRFADDGERDHAFGELRALGLDPEDVETDGYHHTWLYLARPQAEAEPPVAELLAPVV
jgi:hypothetical protein